MDVFVDRGENRWKYLYIVYIVLKIFVFYFNYLWLLCILWVYMLYIYFFYLGSFKCLKVYLFFNFIYKLVWDFKFVSIKSCIEEKICDKCDILFMGIYWELV